MTEWPRNTWPLGVKTVPGASTIRHEGPSNDEDGDPCHLLRVVTPTPYCIAHGPLNARRFADSVRYAVSANLAQPALTQELSRLKRPAPRTRVPSICLPRSLALAVSAALHGSHGIPGRRSRKSKAAPPARFASGNHQAAQNGARTTEQVFLE